jgi:hypothetical protein
LFDFGAGDRPPLPAYEEWTKRCGAAPGLGHKVRFVTKIDMAIVMAQFKASVQ